jgi:hypothetical protein
MERIGRSGFGFGGVDPWVAVHPESPGLDPSGRAFHRFDECQPPVGFCLGEHLVEFPSL